MPGAKLSPEQTQELYLFLVLHGKQSMPRTVKQIQSGASVTDIARGNAALGGDARVLENLIAGRLVHTKPSWRRRTARAAKQVTAHEANLSPELVRNARAVLDEVEMLS